MLHLASRSELITIKGTIRMYDVSSGHKFKRSTVIGVLQALVLLLQIAWGARWFVPKRFLPVKYDYHRPVVPREVAEGGLDSSSSPPDVETGDGGEWSFTLAVLVKACRKECTWLGVCMVGANLWL